MDDLDRQRAYIKQIIWLGSSRKDLKLFPDEVRDEMGYARYAAQKGDRPASAKTLVGFGSAKIVELRESDRSGTYRVVYTVEVEGIIFVLHAFQKKSKSGVATTKRDMDLVRQRLKEVDEYFQ